LASPRGVEAPEVSAAPTDRLTARRTEDLFGDLPRQAGGRSWIEYSAAQVRTVCLGGEAWIFTRTAEDRTYPVAYGILERGRIRAGLGLTWISESSELETALADLRRFVSRRHVSEFWIESVGPSRARIPELPRETMRYADQEMFLVDLTRDDPFGAFASNHRRNVRKAAKAGVELLRLSPDEACAIHLDLIRRSVSRRLERGERSWKSTNLERIRTLLGTGHGALFQAGSDGRVLSSKLVLTFGDCAFYETGGSSPDGMAVGASQFLMSSIIDDLVGRDFKTLNLGVVPDDDAGLRRFKAGFGASVVRVDRAYASVGNVWTKAVNASAYLVRAFAGKGVSKVPA